MKKLKYTITILLIITFITQVVHIFLLNKVTTDSIYASKIKEEIKNLEARNMNLKMEILKYNSMDNLSSRAAALGFVESKNFLSLYSPLEVAIKR